MGVTPPLESDEESLLVLCDRFQIFVGDHASVAHENESPEREAGAQVADDFLNRGVVDAVARPDVMRDGPARDHHHADDHLHILGLAVAAVAVLGEVVRTCALEVRTGDVVEHQIGVEAEQVAEAAVERHFDPVFGVVQLIEGAVPGVELTGVHTDPPALVPMGDEASALTIADEVGFEPAGQAMLAGRSDESIGDEHERTVSERDAIGPSEVLVKDGPEAQLIEQGADDEDRSPRGGIEDLGIGSLGGGGGRAVIAAQESLELGEDLGEEIFAAQVGDGALLDLAVVAIGFDDTDVFVERAVGRPDFNECGGTCREVSRQILAKSRRKTSKFKNSVTDIVTTLFRLEGGAR